MSFFPSVSVSIRAVAFFLLLSLTPLFAQGFKISIEAEKNNISPGEALQLKIPMQYEDAYQPRAWIVTFYESDVPQEFLDALDLRAKLSKATRPEWRYVNYSTSWLPANKRDSKELEAKIVTSDKWPAGDYRCKISVLFRQKGAADPKTDKYIASSFSFTLEEKKPAEAEAQKQNGE
jgi:hypothetical protein